MNRVSACILLLLVSSVGLAQEATDTSKRVAATKLEAFSARTGVVLIKGFTTIGMVGGGRGSVSVDARELRDAGNTKSREFGITMEVKESGRLERENISYIDADEIDSLLRGIDYISKIESSVTTLGNFEAVYKTKGDFSITTFSYNGEINVAVTSGRIGATKAFLSLSDLTRLKTYIVEARAKLDAAKAAMK